jgi:hypothetical protein
VTALPSSSDITGATRTEAQAKAYFTSERDFLAGLLGSDGLPATALATLGALGAQYVAKTSAYTLVAGDRGKVLACSGTWTLGLTAVATLGSGFSDIIANTSTGTITIDPSGAELVNGAATFALGPGRMVLLICTGSAWLTLALAGSVTTSATDFTAGRMIKTGDAGLMGTLPVLASGAGGLRDQSLSGGLFGYNTTGVGQNPDGSGWSHAVAVMRASSALTGSSEFAAYLSGRVTGTAANLKLWWGCDSTTAGVINWTQVFTQRSIVGSVSQSGGIPTGSAFERGSNASGEYVKFADGTLICWAEKTVNIACSTAMVGGFRSSGTAWTYPAAFSAAPVLMGAPGDVVSVNVLTGTAGLSSTTFAFSTFSTQSAADRVARLFAIGRWF